MVEDEFFFIYFAYCLSREVFIGIVYANKIWHLIKNSEYIGNIFVLKVLYYFILVVGGGALSFVLFQISSLPNRQTVSVLCQIGG